MNEVRTEVEPGIHLLGGLGARQELVALLPPGQDRLQTDAFASRLEPDDPFGPGGRWSG